MTFSRSQSNTRKYFPEYFQKCNQMFENNFFSKKYFHLKISYGQKTFSVEPNQTQHTIYPHIINLYPILWPLEIKILIWLLITARFSYKGLGVGNAKKTYWTIRLLMNVLNPSNNSRYQTKKRRESANKLPWVWHRRRWEWQLEW